MQMQNREIAVAAGWSESTDDVDTSNIATENPLILDAPQAPPQDTPTSNALVPNTSLLDAEDRVAPNQIDAEKPVWRNPIPRTILVVIGAGTLGFTLVRLTEGNGLMNQPQSQVATTVSPTSIAQVNGDDKGELQAKLANVGLKQKIAGLKANKAKAPDRSTTNPPATPKPPAVVPVTNVQPRAVSTYNPPPPVVAQAIPRPPTTQSIQSPLPKPISIRPVPPVIPPTQSIPQRSDQTAVRQDPVEQWMAAANIGNYGGMSSVSNSQTTASVPTDDSYQAADYQTNSVATDSSSGWQLSGGLGRPPAQANSKLEINNQPSNYQEVNYSTAATNVVVGTRAAGKLETPIAWNGKLENPGQNFLIQLTEPIKAADKSIAVPKGAYLVAQVSDATESGLIQMSVSSVVVTENGQTSERPISPGAILILGKGGRPLKASAQGRSNRSADLGIAVLSGISSATGLINQPTSQSAFSSGGGFTTTTTNRNPNYIAGFGQGAAQAIVGQMQARNQQARQFIQSEPKVFVLNQGTSVQVFVNQSVAL